MPSPISYSDTLSVEHPKYQDQKIKVSSVVATGPNKGPYYVVVHLNGSKAWIRNITNNSDAIVDIDHLRVVSCTEAGI